MSSVRVRVGDRGSPENFAPGLCKDREAGIEVFASRRYRSLTEAHDGSLYLRGGKPRINGIFLRLDADPVDEANFSRSFEKFILEFFRDGKRKARFSLPFVLSR